MYNIFVRSRGWICLASCVLTLLALLVTVTDSQGVSEAWPYHFYAPAYSHSEGPVVIPTPYGYLGANRDRRILNLFKKGAGPQLVIRQKQSGHGHGHGHGWGHGHGGGHSSGGSSGGSSSGGLLKGWLPKKSFGVHVTGGLGFSFGGKKEEKKEEHQGYGWGTHHGGWGSYHNPHHKGWGSYHKPKHGWGSYHHSSPHGQHSYGYGGYDDEYDDTERSAITGLGLDLDEEDDSEMEVEAEERADLRPRLLLLDNLYEDEEEPFLYSPVFDEYY